jgi:hypothetical protein
VLVLLLVLALGLACLMDLVTEWMKVQMLQMAKKREQVPGWMRDSRKAQELDLWRLSQ